MVAEEKVQQVVVASRKPSIEVTALVAEAATLTARSKNGCGESDASK